MRPAHRGDTRGQRTKQTHQGKLINHRWHLGCRHVGGLQQAGTSHNDVAAGLAGHVRAGLHTHVGTHTCEHAEQARAAGVEIDTGHTHFRIAAQYTRDDGEGGRREVAGHADVGQ